MTRPAAPAKPRCYRCLNAQRRKFPGYVLRRRAHLAVSKALQTGALVRRGCEVCRFEPAEAHHDDYSRPLDVRWLCAEHHGSHHGQRRKNPVFGSIPAPLEILVVGQDCDFGVHF